LSEGRDFGLKRRVSRPLNRPSIRFLSDARNIKYGRSVAYRCYIIPNRQISWTIEQYCNDQVRLKSHRSPAQARANGSAFFRSAEASSFTGSRPPLSTICGSEISLNANWLQAENRDNHLSGMLSRPGPLSLLTGSAKRLWMYTFSFKLTSLVPIGFDTSTQRFAQRFAIVLREDSPRMTLAACKGGRHAKHA
jgi:hypothetical protein